MKERKISRKLFHEFTDGEAREAGLQLAAQIAELEQTRLRKADANKAFKEEMEAAEKEIQRLARSIADRGEDRLTECTVQFHAPVTGTKTVLHGDGTVVAEEAMTPEECQEHLFAEGAGA